ncbi:hypothetical protein TWF730_008349 [Orbilia blumenaviensis]|uniref:Uncharacterized protein n=1 Tax=Orbilia blumenaviensis TaxID=1796055 RepID=A0AAV9V3B5_9PEZI
MELSPQLSSTPSTPSFASSFFATPTPRNPKQIRATALQVIHNYHGLGKKKLGNFHSLHSLKRYTEGEFRKLQASFEEEISKIQSSGIPLAKEITFSNIDDYVSQALADLETEKQTLTHLRTIITMHGKTIVQIAEDLKEEIELVMASGNAGEEVLKEDLEEGDVEMEDEEEEEGED